MQVLKKLLQQNGVRLRGFDRGVLLQETRCYSQSPKPEVHGYMMMAYDWWGTMCKELVIGFLWLLLQKSFWVAVGTIGISDEFPGIQEGSWYTWCLRIRCICAHIVGDAHSNEKAVQSSFISVMAWEVNGEKKCLLTNLPAPLAKNLPNHLLCESWKCIEIHAIAFGTSVACTLYSAYHSIHNTNTPRGRSPIALKHWCHKKLDWSTVRL